MNFGLPFYGGGVKFLIADIWHTICQSAMKFGNVEGLPVETNFVNFSPWVL